MIFQKKIVAEFLEFNYKFENNSKKSICSIFFLNFVQIAYGIKEFCSFYFWKFSKTVYSVFIIMSECVCVGLLSDNDDLVKWQDATIFC